MAADVLDFAGLEETAAAAATPTVDTDVTTDVDTDTDVDTNVDADKNEDGTEKTEEQKTAEAAAKEKAALPGTEKTPAEIRKVLKSLKDADPKNGPVVKQLHGAFERWEAAKQIFPKGVAEMKEAKSFLDLVGGNEGYETLQQTVQAIEASDAKLYAGDPTLFDDILEDLKAEGKTEAFGKLAPAFLDKLKTTDEKAYYTAFAPHFLSGLDEVNIGGAISGVLDALKVADDADPKALLDAITKAKAVAGGMDKWLTGLKDKAQKSKAAELDPERQKLADDRKAFQKQQEEFKTNQSKEYQKGVAVELEKENNKSLGTALKSYLKMPFFKGFPRETLVDLGNGIKTRMFDTLKADKTYQAQMKALWGAKTPDSAKIKEYHNAKVSSIAEEIVRLTVQQRYPGYAKGGSAAGRVAAANAKTAATKKTDAAAAASGKAVYVPQKPKWDAIDFEKDPKQLLYIGGKAYLKGSGKLVTWRK